MKLSRAIRKALADREAAGAAKPDCVVCEERRRLISSDESQGDTPCDLCPLRKEILRAISGKMTWCGPYAWAASDADFYRYYLPRWREDILEIALACELAGD